MKYECLPKLILFSEASLKRVLAEYLARYQTERNHQGKQNILLFPDPPAACPHDSASSRRFAQALRTRCMIFDHTPNNFFNIKDIAALALMNN